MLQLGLASNWQERLRRASLRVELRLRLASPAPATQPQNIQQSTAAQLLLHKGTSWSRDFFSTAAAALSRRQSGLLVEKDLEVSECVVDGTRSRKLLRRLPGSVSQG